MSAVTARMASVCDAIVVDEIGMEVGIFGKYRLKSACQLIFEAAGRMLYPVAVEGMISPYLDGKPVSEADFFARMPPQDRSFVECIGRVMHLRNHFSLGADDLGLYLGCDPSGAGPDDLSGESWSAARQAGEIGIEPSQVVCVISEAAALGSADLMLLAAQMRGHGMRTAIGDFGAGHWSEEQIDLVRPDIVRIDGEWFRKICRDATTVRLFEAVMARLRERKVKVLVHGIEDQMQFAVALRAGADLFQGSHLAGTALVGTVFDETPLSIPEKLGAARKIVPLFG